MANSKTDLKYIFAKNLKRLLYENGESGNKLAKSIAVSNPTVSSWISQTSFPRANTLQKIANHFGVAVSQLTTLPTDKAEALSYLNHFTQTSKADEINSLPQKLGQISQDDFIAYDGSKLDDKEYKQMMEEITKHYEHSNIPGKKQLNKSFPEKLRYLRNQKKLSLQALAHKLQTYYDGAIKYDVNKIWRLEAGINEPTLKDAEAISSVLEVPIAYLTDSKVQVPIDLSNSDLIYSWRGNLISESKVKLIQAFIAGQMNDSGFKP